jgi:glycolate oxidase iron-sulfur subunit
METRLADWIKDTPQGREADAILRKCVHCGFCLATCPTYGLLGDELDSPRGRIYLMKQMLEGAPVTERTQLHLDRCLTCRACETTCPSGVEYGHLVDIGRELVTQKVPRSLGERLRRRLLNSALMSRAIFGMALALGRLARPLLPKVLASKVPVATSPGERPPPRHPRRMLILEGCVQPAIAPSINAATARVLDRLGISLEPAPRAGCCGAVSHHLDFTAEARVYMKANVDAWWSALEGGVEAIVITASGCGAMVRDYGHLLRDDPVYAEKAARVSAAARDIAEVIGSERDRLAELWKAERPPQRVAFQAPCTLQHALRIQGAVESLLRDAGYSLTAVPDAHLCCGSAGTYSILQPELSQRLLRNKVRALESAKPEAIATANIGCLAHVQSGTPLPVAHWIELVDQRLE